MSYTIKIDENAMVINGKVPVSDLTHLCGIANDYGFDNWDIGLARALKVSFVITNAEKSKTLRDSIDRHNQFLDLQNAWLAGWDTGISSRVIFSVMTGRYMPENDRYKNENHPFDPADFGRCYRLLKIFPEWRERIEEMAQISPVWEAMSRSWTELECLYREGLPIGRALKLYDRMQDLIKVAQS